MKKGGKDSGRESDDGSTAVVASECEPSAPVDAASDSTFTEQVHDIVQDIEDVGRFIS